MKLQTIVLISMNCLTEWNITKIKGKIHSTKEWRTQTDSGQDGRCTQMVLFLRNRLEGTFLRMHQEIELWKKTLRHFYSAGRTLIFASPISFPIWSSLAVVFLHWKRTQVSLMHSRPRLSIKNASSNSWVCSCSSLEFLFASALAHRLVSNRRLGSERVGVYSDCFL